MPSTTRYLLSPSGSAPSVPSTGPLIRGLPGFPTGLVARRGELVGVADGLEVLLCDLEQHRTEVVRDERGDRRQQRAERVDEQVGLLGVGDVARLEGAPNVLVEHLDRIGGDPHVRVVVPPRRAQEIGEREPGLEEAQPGAEPSASASVYPDSPSRCWATISPSLTTTSSSGAGTPTRPARSSSDEERRAVEVAALQRAGDRGREGASAASSSPATRRRITASEKPWRWRSRMRARRSTCSVPYQAMRPTRCGGGSSWRFW